MSDLVLRMEDTRRAIRLACDSLLFADNEAARIVLQSLGEQIGMWQSEIIRQDRERAILERQLREAREEG